MSDVRHRPFEFAITRGEALRRMVGGVPASPGRRADDAERPDILAVRRLFEVYLDWDRENLATIREVFAAPEPFVQRYLAVERPDRQLFITDFGSIRARVANGIADKLELLRTLEDVYENIAKGHPQPLAADLRPQRVFLGHGRSADWRELKEFVEQRLGLPVEEFNRESVASLTVEQRLSAMLERCTVALLVMTPDNPHADGSLHARENVIHEIGRAQGKLGTTRTIVLLESGCASFSNLDGTLQLRFASGGIKACFEDVRHALEREGCLRRPAA